MWGVSVTRTGFESLVLVNFVTKHQTGVCDADLYGAYDVSFTSIYKLKNEFGGVGSPEVRR